METHHSTTSAHRPLVHPRRQPVRHVIGRIAGAALSVALSACAVAAPGDGAPAKAAAPVPSAAPSAAPSGALSAADLLSAIRVEIGQPTCTADSQCRSLPVGHKACGGPETHLAWSTAVSNQTRLLALANRHAQARRKEVEARGLMSNCQVQADPGAVCRQGRCVPADGPGAAAGGGAMQAR